MRMCSSTPAYGSKILSLQPSYARPVLAVGGTHFVVYNRAGSELTVCSRTRTLYTQRFDEDILLCAMSKQQLAGRRDRRGPFCRLGTHL